MNLFLDPPAIEDDHHDSESILFIITCHTSSGLQSWILHVARNQHIVSRLIWITFILIDTLISSIIGTGKQRLLIDTGEPDIPEYLVNLKRVLIEKDISLTKILLTHWHPDHVGGTKSILQEVASQGLWIFFSFKTKVCLFFF